MVAIAVVLFLWSAACCGLTKPGEVGVSRRRSHDPGKVITDLALALTLGGDCLSTSGCALSQRCSAGPCLRPGGIAHARRTRSPRTGAGRWPRLRLLESPLDRWVRRLGG